MPRNKEQILKLFKRSPTEEILTEERLTQLITEGTPLNHYIGFEISGFVHLGTGLLSMSKVADLQAAGANTNLFLADYHSWINKKLGGDLSAIRKIAGGYFKEALKMSLKCAGGDTEKVNFLLGSELYEKLGRDYFENVLKIASTMSLSRTKRSITIMGRKEGDEVNLSQFMYVPMQAADIYSIGVNIAHGGMDQRKVHVIALEASNSFAYKPVALHQHLLMGIHITEQQRNSILSSRKANNRAMLEDQLIDIKMSKSKPDSAIFIHDTEEDIRKKINDAFCPLKETEVNPIIDLMRYVIVPYLDRKNERLEIVNNKTKQSMAFLDIASLESAYRDGKIHPADLKATVAENLIKILEPARKFFLDGNGKKYMEEMKEIKITR
ncbi:MAG: tyrosine--tRNA ligase [Candidatus Micrarchaeia archaeon]